MHPWLIQTCHNFMKNDPNILSQAMIFKISHNSDSFFIARIVSTIQYDNITKLIINGSQ